MQCSCLSQQVAILLKRSTRLAKPGEKRLGVGPLGVQQDGRGDVHDHFEDAEERQGKVETGGANAQLPRVDEDAFGAVRGVLYLPTRKAL